MFRTMPEGHSALVADKQLINEEGDPLDSNSALNDASMQVDLGTFQHGFEDTHAEAAGFGEQQIKSESRDRLQVR